MIAIAPGLLAGVLWLGVGGATCTALFFARYQYPTLVRAMILVSGPLAAIVFGLGWVTGLIYREDAQ